MSDTPPASSPPVSSVPTTGRIAGLVVASDTGLPLAGVQVQIAGTTGTTAIDGSFSQDVVGSADRQVVRLVRDGYADAFITTAVTSGATASVTGRMAPIAASATFDNSAGKTLTDSASAASVTIPPSGVVDATSGAAPQGAITIKIATINPATNPANMPGDYTSSTGSTIESYGALSVQLRDAAGKPLNLAAGKSATIRIPLASRSSFPSQTIPLFYFNETTGLWVEEGTATLAGVAPNQYYEGTVTHFSTWNADRAVDRIFVNGCVTGSGDVSSGVVVRSSGIDYSGLAMTTTNSEGKFRVAIRRNGLASISAAYPRRSTAVRAGPSATDVTLDTCLTLSPASEKSTPVFFAPLPSMVAPAGSPVAFYALVVFEDEALTYQWLRNGRAIDGATQSIYRLPVVTSADDQAQFTVTVTNSSGSTTSSAATLSVTAAATLVELDYLFKNIYIPFDLSAVTSDPLNLFEFNGKWLDPAAVCRTGTATGLLNGQPIPAGTETSGFTQVVSGIFDKCVTRDDTTIELSGFSTSSETSNNALSVFEATRRADNFRRISRQGNGEIIDITGNGSEKSTTTMSMVNGLEISSSVSAPFAGGTLRNNLTGEVTQFISGDTVIGSTEIISGKLATTTIEQRSRTFTIGGVRYVANGLLSFPFVTDYQLPGPEQLRLLSSAPAPSGQLSLTRNGFLIGRIFFTAEGPFVEINGVVKPMFSKRP